MDDTEPPLRSPAERKGTEEIVVTGSRIRTSPLDTPTPILGVSQEDLKRTGIPSSAEILQRLPISGGALNTKFNSSGNFGFPPDGGGIGAGASEIDLRYLGSKRTLVLVDGVRWVHGSSASGVSGATDLNTIPLGIIERIEILEDGASAIYGSDAIAGVVNIITKRNYDESTASAYLGGYVNHGDGLTQNYDVTWGASGDRARMLLSLSFMHQGRVWANDRDISRFPSPYFTECTGGCSSGTPQGRFVFTDPNTNEAVDVTINDGVMGIPTYDPSNPTGGDFHGFTTADRFNFAAYNYMLTPSERFGFFDKLEYELTDTVTLHAKVLYNRRVSKNQAAPEPIFIGPEAGNGNRLDRISIHETNPFNPFGFTLDASTNPYFIGRRPIEAGPRIYEQTVNTVYASGGLGGSFTLADRLMYWDITGVYSVNRADQIKQGGFNSAKLEKALGPVDECNADPDCVPFNIFGGQKDGRGSITQPMLDYVQFIQKDLSQQELVDVVANLSGELLQLPAGWLSVGVGAEYRHYEGFFRPDSVVTAGDSAGVPSSPTSGDYGVGEAYLEVAIPLVRERPGADLLDLAGAVRYSDYSTFGAEETYKLGLRYRPVPDLLFRGSFAQGFRAPNIGELFGTDARFDQTLSDPCSDLAGMQDDAMPASEEIQANCEALSVPTDGSYQQLNPQISVTTGGNSDLEPETSRGWLAGIAYSPQEYVGESAWADELGVEVNWWRINLDNAIRAVDAQVQLDQCVATLDPVYCEGISRTGAGTINGFTNRLTNIGGLDVQGLDVNLNWTSPLVTTGRYRVASMTSFLIEFNERVPGSGPTGFDTIERVGNERGDPEQAYPRLKSTLIADWFLGPWMGSVIGRYIHSVTEECRGFESFPDTCSDFAANDDESTNQLSPTVYLDAQLSWQAEPVDENLTITIGVNNLLDQEPPACYSCALNGFDASTYDVPGIFGWLRAGYVL